MRLECKFVAENYYQSSGSAILDYQGLGVGVANVLSILLIGVGVGLGAFSIGVGVGFEMFPIGVGVGFEIFSIGVGVGVIFADPESVGEGATPGFGVPFADPD